MGNADFSVIGQVSTVLFESPLDPVMFAETLRFGGTNPRRLEEVHDVWSRSVLFD